MFYYLEKDVKLQFKSKLVFTVKPVSSVVNRDEEGYYDDTDIMSRTETSLGAIHREVI